MKRFFAPTIVLILATFLAIAGCTVSTQITPQIPGIPSPTTTTGILSATTAGTPFSTPVQSPIVEPVITTAMPATVSVPVSPAPVTYKTVELDITKPNVFPVYGFRMDYPSDWSYQQDHLRDWRAGYNFTSPDGKSRVLVYVDDTSGTANYWYSITRWADNVIRELKTVYCLDSNANPSSCTASQNSRDYHRRYLVSNDPVSIQGAFEARRLIFKSSDDRNFGEETVYVIHAGNMEGYNFTVPDHYEVGVKAPGPVWDYGIGGQGYLISFYSPSDRVEATREIFSHMINSFRVTP